jgi:hypothetical protein
MWSQHPIVTFSLCTCTCLPSVSQRCVRGIDSPAAAPYRPLPYPRHSACCCLGGEVLVLAVVVVCPQSSSQLVGWELRSRKRRALGSASAATGVRASGFCPRPPQSPCRVLGGESGGFGANLVCNMYLRHISGWLSSTGRIGLRSSRPATWYGTSDLSRRRPQ